MSIPLKYSAAGNRILPNTFQHPNIFVDRLMAYLTPEENTVLTFSVRRILGFQDNISSRRDKISLTQFVSGQKSLKDGTPLSNGCGMGVTAVRSALETLAKYKILLPTTEKPDPLSGQEYWLQENELAIDWDGLELRLVEKRDREIRRTQKARCSVGQKGSVGQNSKGSVGQKEGVLSDSNTKPNKTNLQTQNSVSVEPLGLDWKMLADQEITQEHIDKAIKEKEIADHFERTFGFNALPWATNAVWEKFFKFIVRVHEADPNMFTDYAAWRNGAGKYKAMSNKQIRMNPQVFMDTGYPEFEASKMYAKQEPKRKNTPVSQEEFRQGLAEWVQERSQKEVQNV